MEERNDNAILSRALLKYSLDVPDGVDTCITHIYERIYVFDTYLTGSSGYKLTRRQRIDLLDDYEL